MDITQQKLQILNQSAEAKRQTLLQHEVNISIYTTAIAQIDSLHSDNSELQSFKSQLTDWIVGQQREQSKEAVMLSAIEAQIAHLSVS